MLSRMKDLARRGARALGFEVFAYNHRRVHDLRKRKLLRDLDITLVFDGGANAGQYGRQLRAAGYTGRIASFEPIPEVFEELQAAVAGDPKWEAIRVALGERDGEADFHVAEFSQVSSLLPATGASITGEWTRTRQRRVPLRRLDSIALDHVRPDDRVYLKLDIQGYELQALAGAEQILGHVLAVEVELSTLPLYRGEGLLPEVVHWLAQRGFGVFSADTVAVDHLTGRVLQFEVLLVNDVAQSAGGLLLHEETGCSPQTR
ncbi:MAG TPA: FkbM family methyltransferase [Gemmataceae bacterium]|nr:FkbM family methyltransferase [Gemmataceae bacterium]